MPEDRATKPNQDNQISVDVEQGHDDSYGIPDFILDDEKFAEDEFQVFYSPDDVLETLGGAQDAGLILIGNPSCHIQQPASDLIEPWKESLNQQLREIVSEIYSAFGTPVVDKLEFLAYCSRTLRDKFKSELSDIEEQGNKISEAFPPTIKQKMIFALMAIYILKRSLDDLKILAPVNPVQGGIIYLSCEDKSLLRYA